MCVSDLGEFSGRIRDCSSTRDLLSAVSWSKWENRNRVRNVRRHRLLEVSSVTDDLDAPRIALSGTRNNLGL